MALSLLPTLLTACAVLATAGEAECPTKCGDVSIPYPFGIGAGCFRSKGFEISCVKNGTMELALLASSTTHRIQVTNLSVAPQPEAKVMLSVAYRCYDSAGNTVSLFDGHVDLNKHGVFRISDSRNMFVVLGCNTGAYTSNSRNNGRSGRYDYNIYMGCFTYCSGPGSAMDGRCASVGCCHVNIAPGLTDNVVEFEDWPHNGTEYSPCDIAFLVDNSSYSFRAADLRMDVNRTSMPVWLDWAIRDDDKAISCAAAKNTTRYACVSANSECVDSNLSSYFCRCKQGFEGNPYQDKNGCTNIDECTRPEEYPCYGVCTDTEGSYQCKCRTGYMATDGGPKKQRCTPKFPVEARLAVGISLCIFSLVLIVLLTLMIYQRRRMNQLFKKNGGSVLQKVDTIKIFTKEELNKITKNYSHILGKGGSGQVYKGTLHDSTVVAVKSSIEISEALKEDFTNEVIVQSQMIHKNIIKILGCCLEVDVPMLVYEFAPNGNLHNVLHGKFNSQLLPLSLDIRLDIVTESAEGLKYMHSSTNHTIRHGDVKSANILLDDNFMPKISDFGTSKLLGRGEAFTVFVVGSMGYIDPVFHQTGLLTQKSDVYSFGVVLLEVICRKPTIYDENRSLIIDFHTAHRKQNGRSMFDKDILVTEEDVLVLEEIGNLAMECLKEGVEDRPDMKEVAERLIILRRARKHRDWNYWSAQNFEDNNVIRGSPSDLRTGINETRSTVPLIQAMSK